MNAKSIYAVLLTGLLAGCGNKGEDSDHAHGESSGAGGSATIQKLDRPASKLKKVKANEAWKTPLNLALFITQQHKGKSSYWNHHKRLVIALVEAGEFQQATEVALLFPSESGAFALGYVAKATAESGDAIQASKVAQWIEPPSDRAIALCHAATAQLKAGDKPTALAKIRQAESLARKIPQKDKVNVLIEIASVQLVAGEKQQAVATCQQALKIVRANKNSFVVGNQYKRIAKVLIGAGEIQKTKGMIQFSNDLMGRTMSASTRVDVALIMAEEGEVDAALEWVGQFPDKQKKAEAYGNIATVLAQNGQFARAMEVLKNDKSWFSSKSQAMKNIAIAMAKVGKIKEAIELVPQMRGGMAREPALRAIASAQVAAGQKEPALATLKQAEEAAEKVAEMFLPKRDVLKNIAFILAEAGEKEQAAAKLKEAVEEILKAEANQYTPVFLGGMAIEMAKIGDETQAAIILKQAVESAQEIKDANKKANTLSRISHRLTQAGQYKQAMETVQLIEAAERKKSAMQGLARVLPVLPETNMRLRHINFIDIKRMKKSFTPEEQEFAKQLVFAIQAK